MTEDMKENGIGAYCWGLIVGYDEEDETYTIRHPFVHESFTFAYNAFDPATPGGFEVRVLQEGNSDDKRALHLEALQNAVRFANGTKYTDENFRRPDGKQAARYGFAAYDVWRKAFTSGEPLASGPQRQKHNAEELRLKRRAAAVYLRELTTVFPEAAEALEAGAAYYDSELPPVDSLVELFDSIGDREEYTEVERAEAGRLIDHALEAERKALSQIEMALATIEAE